ncbi:hypothetical protein QBC37DRAFT_169179 [Rhypophila decipiens]|uniref:Tyrosinase copper-binding domain-containing protein n=1 Tax=Rhypophila decipiens TaxID=261697 RepID=A0AAN7BA66_9PEZI|nr:hypothetical protein QBC37DRAFT_169179 [Rhypophila decipiens]
MLTTWSYLLLPALLGGVRGVAVADSVLSWQGKYQVHRNPFYPVDVVEKFAESSIPKVEAYMKKKIAAGKNNGCTLENAVVRREWSDMSIEMREEYVAATKCLMNLPGIAPRDKFPGVVSRFDDFVAYHMVHAAQLHDMLHLFAAHRYYVWVYEQALRNECNYTGYQPYMNYDRYTKEPEKSPLFNGNSSSMGGTGEYDPNYIGVNQPARNPNLIKSAGGGGCVKSGPFSDMVVNLGPTSSSTAPKNSVPRNPQSNGLGLNPRCLRRDINAAAALGATAAKMLTLLNNTDMNGFYNELLGNPPPKNDPYPWGVHTAGHYIHAVDPGGDPSSSPGDPVFYFHHGALDRLWWLWQMQDPEMRLNVIPTAGGMPPGSMPHRGERRGALGRWVDWVLAKRQEHEHEMNNIPAGSVIDLEFLAPSIPLVEAHDQLGGLGGKFCYIYV